MCACLCVCYLLVNFAGRYGGVLQVSRVAVGFVSAAAGRNSIGGEINAGKPASVVQNSTTAQLKIESEEVWERCFLVIRTSALVSVSTYTPLDVVHRNAFLILGVVVLNSLIVGSQKGAFDLRRKTQTLHQMSTTSPPGAWQMENYEMHYGLSVENLCRTSWRKTKPEMPAISSARKTRERNMAYYREIAKICCIVNKFKYFNSSVFLKSGWIWIDNELEVDWVLHNSAWFRFKSLTSLSIHGLPRQVAKHPNSPKTMIVVPVPMST